MELFGTHGTTKSRTSKIINVGFTPGSRSGKACKGVYFWAGTEGGSLSCELARNWWFYANANNWYRGDSDKRCSVISVKINVDDSSFYDCNSPEFQQSLFEIADGNLSDSNDLAALYDLLIHNLEQELGVEFEVIEFNALVPNTNYKSSVFLGAVSNVPCYVVRRSWSQRISILNVNSKF